MHPPQPIHRPTNAGSPSDQESEHDVEMQRRRRTSPPLPRKKWWWQQPRWKAVQYRLVTLVISGFFLAILVSIYLGIALYHRRFPGQEWQVLLVLIIMLSTVFFCHSLVRLCIDVTSLDTFDAALERTPSIAAAGPGGFANPREPIRINTQSPAVLEEPPPVYGFWRCSVRVNPDQFFWARQQNTEDGQVGMRPEEEAKREAELGGLNRPPSYISDDGVSYVVSAVPEARSIDVEPLLPPHPSELRRLQH